MQLKLHATSYTKTLNSLYHGHPMYQYIQINLQENILKSILVNIFLSSLRSKVPPDRHTRYLVSRQNMVCRSLVSPTTPQVSSCAFPGVSAGTTRNDQQSYRLRLPCRRKSESQMGCLRRREGGGGGSPYSLHRCFTQSSKTTTPPGYTHAGRRSTGRVKMKKKYNIFTSMHTSAFAETLC